MMWYTIYALDTENSLQKRLKARPEHLKRLNDLLNEGSNKVRPIAKEMLSSIKDSIGIKKIS